MSPLNPDTDLIYSHSDWLTQALPPVLKRLGYGPAGEENHVFVVSSGAMPFGLPHVKSGYIDMTTEIPTLKVSKLAAYWLLQVAQGNEIPDEVNLFEPGLSVKMTDKKVKIEEKSWGTHIAVPPAVVTQNNVEDPNLWGNIYD
jgi:ABC-type sugar transport system substrate-binding protein